jgi:hypothetical protein
MDTRGEHQVLKGDIVFFGGGSWRARFKIACSGICFCANLCSHLSQIRSFPEHQTTAQFSAPHSPRSHSLSLSHLLRSNSRALRETDQMAGITLPSNYFGSSSLPRARSLLCSPDHRDVNPNSQSGGGHLPQCFRQPRELARLVHHRRTRRWLHQQRARERMLSNRQEARRVGTRTATLH